MFCNLVGCCLPHSTRCGVDAGTMKLCDHFLSQLQLPSHFLYQPVTHSLVASAVDRSPYTHCESSQLPRGRLSPTVEYNIPLNHKRFRGDLLSIVHLEPAVYERPNVYTLQCNKQGVIGHAKLPPDQTSPIKCRQLSVGRPRRSQNHLRSHSRGFSLAAIAFSRATVSLVKPSMLDCNTSVPQTSWLRDSIKALSPSAGSLPPRALWMGPPDSPLALTVSNGGSPAIFSISSGADREYGVVRGDEERLGRATKGSLNTRVAHGQTSGTDI